MGRIKHVWKIGCIIGIVLGIFCKPIGYVQAQENKNNIELYIDNENIYEEMEQSYSEGYVPKIIDGKAMIAIPILCNEELKNQMLRASVKFPEEKKLPFLKKNYVKNIKIDKMIPKGKEKEVLIYYVIFEMELKKDRINGSYPVVIALEGTTSSNDLIKKDIKLYVTIADGKLEIMDQPQGNSIPNEETEQTPNPPEEDSFIPDVEQTEKKEEPVFAPKVVVKSCTFSEKEIQAGQEFSVEITLLNTSKKQAAKNMTAMISGQGEFFQLLDQTDTRYIEKVAAGKTTVLTYHYRVYPSAPQAQYGLELVLDYAGEDGTAYNLTGKVNVSVIQPVKIEFDAPAFAEKLPVADVVNAEMQVMNLGRSKIYHVRAKLEADGLRPEGTIFMGDIEPGTTMEGSTSVVIEGLKAGDSSYGKTEGKVILYYEDELGREYQEEKPVHTEIISPFTEEESEEENQQMQWWVIMAVIVTVICMTGGIFVMNWWKKRKREDEMFE